MAVDLVRNQDGKWVGTFALPEQRLTPVAVSNLTITNVSVHFESRESLFGVDGTISGDGKSIEGDFQSAFLLAIPVPIRLQWISEPVQQAPVVSTRLTKELEGNWQGTLTYGASWEENDSRFGSQVAIRVTLSKGNDGIARGTFQRLGSNDPELPLSAIEQNHGSVHFEVRGAGVSFWADLKNHELRGEWRQFDLDPAPLTLHQVETK